MAGEDSKDPKTEEVRGATSAEQAEYLFQNMKDTLESLGSGLEHVIKTTIYLTDARHADGYREARKKYLPHAPPSTLIMGVQLASPRCCSRLMQSRFFQKRSNYGHSSRRVCSVF